MAKSRRSTRRQKGGENGMNAPAGNVMKQQGGKRKSKKQSPWNKLVMETYREMKRKNAGVSFSDALKEASKRKKRM